MSPRQRQRGVFQQPAKPGAKRSRKTTKPLATHLPHRVARRKDELDHKVKPVPAKEIRCTLKDQLTQLKEQAQPTTKLPASDLPHRVARQQDEREREGPMANVMGAGAVIGGLEAQIGSLSMQYHSLMLMLVSAKGRRATQIKSQLMVLEQKLTALNLELEKKKLLAKDSNKPVI